MASAKDLIVKPISSADARAAVKKYHYSGKVVNNSQLHLGVFLGGRLEGVMSFGPSMDKRKIQGLVRDTAWNGFIELNRMAFSDRLPRNSESRALSVAFRMIKQHYPHIEWVVSFADGAQCGDGTIYRASGFVLTSIKKNDQIWKAPSGETFARMSLTDGKSKQQQQQAKAVIRHSVTKGKHMENGAASMRQYADAGFKPIDGYQLRYIYFLNQAAKVRLTCDILPFAKIAEIGAGMYKGESIKRDKQAFTESIGVAAGQNRPSRSTIPDGAQSCP